MSANPYVGPRAFQWGEHIYGRDLETYKLANLLSAERIVLLYSPSGAGKTSLIYAALIPELQEREFHLRTVVRVNREPAKLSPSERENAGNTQISGSSPPAYNRYIFSMLSSLESALPEAEQIAEEQLVGMSLADYLERRPRPAETNFEVFIFDQFEEVLILDATDQDAKHEFFDQVGQMLGDRTRWALFSMREDFKAALDPFVLPIPTRFSTTFRLELLGVEAAHQAMQGPAKAAGVNFTLPAADALIDDLRLVQVQNPDGTYRAQLGPVVEPVQLQVVCYRLWESLPADTAQIDVAHLAGIKNVGQALADYYALRVAEVAEKARVSERLIREWFENELITEGGIRGQVLMGAASSHGLDNRAISLLQDAHLVRAEKRGNSIWYELSHDRMIAPVKANNAIWFEDNLSLLQRQAALWNNEDRPDGLLVVGKGLADIQNWASAHTTDLMPGERDFLTACNKAQQSADRERRRNRIMAVLAVLTALAAILAVLFGVASQGAERRALDSKVTAQAASILAVERANAAITAEADALNQKSSALTSAQEAQKQKETAVAAQQAADASKGEAETARDNAIQAQETASAAGKEALQQRNIAEAERLKAVSHQLASYSQQAVQSDPDLGLLLAVEANAVTDTFEARASLLQGLSTNDHLMGYLRGHVAVVYDLDFSQDGSLLASGGEDGFRLWDVSRGIPATRTLTGTMPTQRVALSPDGKLLAASDCYGAIRLIDTTPSLAAPFLRATLFTPWNNLACSADLPGDMVFSPDGTWLAVSLSAPEIILWDISTYETYTLAASADNITRLAFSPDGSWLASGEVSGQVRLWSTPGAGSIPVSLANSPLTDTVSLLAFSPVSGAQALVAVSASGESAAIWDINSGTAFTAFGNIGVKNLATISADAQIGAGAEGYVINLVPALESSFSAHTAPVTALAITADGNQLASADSAGTIILWGTRATNLSDLPILTDRTIYNLVMDSSGGGTAPSGGGTAVFGGSQEALYTWDIASRQLSRQVTLPLTVTTQISITPLSLAFRPDGKLVAAGADGSAFVWDIPTQKMTRTAASGQPFSYINSVSVDPRGEKIIIGDYGKLYVLDIASGLAITITNDFSSSSAPLLSPDGRTLAVSDGYGNIGLLDYPGGDLINTIVSENTYMMLFSADGSQLATGSYYGWVDVWDVASRQVITSFQAAPGSSLQALAFSQDGSLLAAGGDEGVIRITDLRTGSMVETQSSVHSSILCLAFSPDGTLLASSGVDGIVRLWEPSSGAMVGSPLAGHTRTVTSLAFSPDGIWLASASSDNTIRVWQARSSQPVGSPLIGQVTQRYAPSTNTVAVSSDGLRLALGSFNDGLITLFDLRGSSPVTQVLTAHSSTVVALAFSPDAHYLASGGADGKLTLWDAASGALLQTLFVSPGSDINTLRFSPDGKTLAAGIGTEITLWDISTANPAGKSLKGHASAVIGLAFSQNKTTLASQEIGGNIILWDLSSNRLVRKIEILADTDSYYTTQGTLAFNPDGSILATGVSDNRNEITLWDTASGKKLGVLRGHSNVITSLVFSPDGNSLISAGWDNAIHVWEISPLAWQASACNLASRNLSWQEWKLYMAESGQTYRPTCPTNPVNYNDVAQGYVEQIQFLIKTQETDQAQQLLSLAVDLITRQNALEPAVTLCLMDLPPTFQAALAPACRLAADKTTGTASAGYSLKVGDRERAALALELASQDAVRRQDAYSATLVCDYGISHQVPQGVSQACLLVAQKASDDPTAVAYYLKAGEVVSATATLQRASQQAVKNNSFDQAFSICRLGSTYQLLEVVKPACLVAAETATDDTSRIEFYALGGNTASAMRVLQDATRSAMASVDIYTAGLLCTTGTRYHLQPTSEEACRYAAEKTGDLITSADYYAMAGDRQKAEEGFTLALSVTLNSGDDSVSNFLCWIGSIDGFAKLVKPACEYAVTHASAQTPAYYQDARGLARALSGDFQGAADDFQALIDWLRADGYYYFDDATRDRYIAERQGFIEALRAGRNPFDADILFALRDE